MNYTQLFEDIEEPNKITSIDFNKGKLAITGIDRKWSMFINKNRYKDK